MLKIAGFLAWGGCLLVLSYQGLSWALFNEWPSITLLDVLDAIFNIDILSIIQAFPLGIAARTLYICFTTQLSLFLWWAGVVMFGLMFINQFLTKK